MFATSWERRLSLSRMGKIGACNGLISRAQKRKMALKVKKAIEASKKVLGAKYKAKKLPEGCLETTFKRPYWLPEGWFHGVKVGTSGYTGRGLQVYVALEGKRFYHRKDVEKYLGRELTREDGAPPTFEEMLKNVMHRVREVQINAKVESKLFSCLTAGELAKLPAASAFHFCVISARRTSTVEGMKDCLLVQAHFNAVGIKPRWYVDGPSLKGYRLLGLDAVKDGGGLVAARNKALADAAKAGKVCCQVSDDISRWQFYNAAPQALKSEAEANQLANRTRKLVIGPVAAARFLVAKMRASESSPKLGGVLPNDNVARGFLAPPYSSKSFILGDFFVCEKSPVRFDTRMTLKEDFDFSCAHIAKHGAVLRCNRMSLCVKHRSNAGGAVTVRNSKEEQLNIKLLRKKWPKAIRLHTTREDEVILQWPKS